MNRPEVRCQRTGLAMGRLDGMTETNWAGSYTYAAPRFARPGTVVELQEIVADADRAHALGTRHTFNDIADTDGVLIELGGLPRLVEVDETDGTVTVDGGARYGDVVAELDGHGRALANLASLPHISIAGAVATATHGSGSSNRNLSDAVVGLEWVGPDGALLTATPTDPDWAGLVVSIGALGIVTRLTLRTLPTFDVRQDVFTDLPWGALEADLPAIFGSAYSVSLFTRFTGEVIPQVWLKARMPSEAREDFLGAPPATETMHMLPGADALAVTEQGGLPGPWFGRLPHFRLEFTPSNGAEIQSEYLVPRDRALEAVEVMRRLGPELEPILQVGELRAVAADELWLSSSYETDVMGIHLTWVRDQEAVDAATRRVEEGLLPLGARPHWGKAFSAGHDELAEVYPRLRDFATLRERLDPEGVFRNAFLDRVLGL